MARKAKNPGVGRGHGERPKREFTCVDCGLVFLAARSDAKRCSVCRARFSNSLDKRAVQPGVGTGHGARPKREFTCVDCGTTFEAARSDAVRCKKCGDKRWSRYETRQKSPCIVCGKPTVRRSDTCRSCRAKARTGDKNPNWQGGHTITDSGYIHVRVGGRYVPEHRFVWETANGSIPAGFEVHHLNGNRQDNRLENLAALTKKEHHTQHAVYTDHIAVLEARIRELEQR